MHGDGAWVHGKVQGNGAASDNGARGRCRGVRGGAGRGTGQSAITVHGDGVITQEKGTGAERDNGARGRCTGGREGAGRDGAGRDITVHGRAREGAGDRGQRAITVHGDGARVHGKVQEGDRGRAR